MFYQTKDFGKTQLVNKFNSNIYLIERNIMTTTNDIKEWRIYDAKSQTFLEFSHTEFKKFVNNRPKFEPIKFKDAEILNTNLGKMVWIDGIINNEHFK